MKLLSLAVLLVLSSKALAAEDNSCTDPFLYHPLYPNNYIDRLDCRGEVPEKHSGQPAAFVFQINKDYEEFDGSVFNPHVVLITRPFLGLWTRTQKVGHLNFERNCVRSKSLVRCTGIGVGIGENEFELVIDLVTMKAKGVYKQLSRGRELVYDFTESHLLNCK